MNIVVLGNDLSSFVIFDLLNTNLEKDKVYFICDDTEDNVLNKILYNSNYRYYDLDVYASGDVASYFGYELCSDSIYEAFSYLQKKAGIKFKKTKRNLTYYKQLISIRRFMNMRLFEKIVVQFDQIRNMLYNIKNNAKIDILFNSHINDIDVNNKVIFLKDREIQYDVLISTHYKDKIYRLINKRYDIKLSKNRMRYGFVYETDRTPILKKYYIQDNLFFYESYPDKLFTIPGLYFSDAYAFVNDNYKYVNVDCDNMGMDLDNINLECKFILEKKFDPIFFKGISYLESPIFISNNWECKIDNCEYYDRSKLYKDFGYDNLNILFEMLNRFNQFFGIKDKYGVYFPIFFRTGEYPIINENGNYYKNDDLFFSGNALGVDSLSTQLYSAIITYKKIKNYIYNKR
ncbi:MAG: hypothetical protein IRZ03_13180 [Acidobacterium ailaaui]|nr:hypothetical protein [Pseudacidobacterium ailaaui]